MSGSAYSQRFVRGQLSLPLFRQGEQRQIPYYGRGFVADNVGLCTAVSLLQQGRKQCYPHSPTRCRGWIGGLGVLGMSLPGAPLGECETLVLGSRAIGDFERREGVGVPSRELFCGRGAGVLLVCLKQ